MSTYQSKEAMLLSRQDTCTHLWSKYHDMEDGGQTLKCNKCGLYFKADGVTPRPRTGK
jgi:hypothetical protein